MPATLPPTPATPGCATRVGDVCSLFVKVPSHPASGLRRAHAGRAAPAGGARALRGHRRDRPGLQPQLQVLRLLDRGSLTCSILAASLGSCLSPAPAAFRRSAAACSTTSCLRLPCPVGPAVASSMQVVGGLRPQRGPVSVAEASAAARPLRPLQPAGGAGAVVCGAGAAGRGAAAASVLALPRCGRALCRDPQARQRGRREEPQCLQALGRHEAEMLTSRVEHIQGLQQVICSCQPCARTRLQHALVQQPRIQTEGVTDASPHWSKSHSRCAALPVLQAAQAGRGRRGTLLHRQPC